MNEQHQKISVTLCIKVILSDQGFEFPLGISTRNNRCEVRTCTRGETISNAVHASMRVLDQLEIRK